MKIFLTLTILLSLSSFAQDPTAYINNFDNKVYSLKTKGVKEFVVDIESPKLTKQVNEQTIFGNVKELIFRTYWTANPSRLSIEVVGLPEGFKEVKEELKLSILPIIESIVPPSTFERFNGYKITAGKKPKEFEMTDSTGIAVVPSFTLKFDNQDKLVEIVGNKPVGTLVNEMEYGKDSFADGKWVLKKTITTSVENGQETVLTKVADYGEENGIAVLKELKVITIYKPQNENAKPLKFEEEIIFKNYKINSGLALKHFLGEQSKSTP